MLVCYRWIPRPSGRELAGEIIKISPSPSCPLDDTAGELASSLWSWGVPGGDPMIRGAKGVPLIIINREKGGYGFVGNPPPLPSRGRGGRSLHIRVKG